MDRYTIQVLPHPHISDWANFLSANRISNIKRDPPSILNVDLNHIDFIKPYHIVSLACLIEEYYKSGSKIEFSLRDGNRVKTYLDKAGFFHYWTDGFDRKKYHETRVATSLCLWQLHNEMIHPYVSFAQKYFTSNFFDKQDTQPLNTSMAELFNNVIDHSQSDVSGYVYTQYYPRFQQIVISLCDFGNGVPATINRYLTSKRKKTLSDTDAIIQAFQKGFSTESTPSNRGFGLDNIASLIKSLKSELLFISNYGILYQQNDGNIVKETISTAFPGTQVVITIDTSRLNPLIVEDLVENNEFLL